MDRAYDNEAYGCYICMITIVEGETYGVRKEKPSGVLRKRDRLYIAMVRKNRYEKPNVMYVLETQSIIQ